MDIIQVLTEVVTQVGFPIVMAGALFWYINKLTESHKEEVRAMMESINSNTNVLSELKELIKVLIKNE